MSPYPVRRRKSVFLGLLMITIGTLLLIHNLLPRLVHLGEIILYWPVLLILWGLALFWDYFAARRANRPAPQTIGRGEFVLILLVSAGAIAFLALNQPRNNPPWQYRFGFFGAPYSFTNTLAPVPVEPQSQVLLWTPQGDITVRPHDSMNLSVVVTKTVRAPSQAEAQKVADATSVASEATPQGVRLEPQLPPEGRGEIVTYDARVSPQISLSVSTGRGNLHIEGIKGQVSANASGNVDLSQIGSNVVLNLDHGDLRIRSVAGNVAITGSGGQVNLSEITGTASLNGRFFGPIRIRRVAKGLQFKSARTVLNANAPLGRLDMESGSLRVSDTSGNLALVTRDEDVEIENVQGTLQVVNRNGDIDVHCNQPPQAAIEITNRSGNINLFLPDRSAFSLTATAVSGDISSAFQTPALRLTERSANSYLEGSVGSHGPKITLHTTYGTIRILRTPPTPPMPPVPPQAPPVPGREPA